MNCEAASNELRGNRLNKSRYFCPEPFRRHQQTESIRPINSREIRKKFLENKRGWIKKKILRSSVNSVYLYKLGNMNIKQRIDQDKTFSNKVHRNKYVEGVG